MIFDRIAIVDWSAASVPSPARPSADAIWMAEVDVASGAMVHGYHRTRAAAAAHLHLRVADSLAHGLRLLIGVDFPLGWPAGFAQAMVGQTINGQAEALALWPWLAARVQDGPDNRNNRFALADAINAGLPGLGPFWGRPDGLDLPHLPTRGSARHGNPFPERRQVEMRMPTAQSCWKLYTTGSVGSQALLGVPVLQGLRLDFPGRVAVWPFQPWDGADVVLAEIYPSLLARQVRALCAGGAIKDMVQVWLLAGALAGMARDGDLAAAMQPDAAPDVLHEEGWVLGVGVEAALRAAAARVEAVLPLA